MGDAIDRVGVQSTEVNALVWTAGEVGGGVRPPMEGPLGRPAGVVLERASAGKPRVLLWRAGTNWAALVHGSRARSAITPGTSLAVLGEWALADSSSTQGGPLGRPAGVALERASAGKPRVSLWKEGPNWAALVHGSRARSAITPGIPFAVLGELALADSPATQGVPCTDPSHDVE